MNVTIVSFLWVVKGDYHGHTIGERDGRESGMKEPGSLSWGLNQTVFRIQVKG